MMGMGRVRVKTPKIAAIPPISFPVKIQCWVHFLLTHTFFLYISGTSSENRYNFKITISAFPCNYKVGVIIKLLVPLGGIALSIYPV